MTENEERYLWLRNHRSRYMDAPYVINTRRSVLYAVSRSRGELMDDLIDRDIFDNKMQELHETNEIVERGFMPEGASRYDVGGPYEKSTS